MSEKQKERIWIMSRPYVNGSFAQQGRQRRKNRIILLVALLAVLCLVGVIAAAIASQGERDPVESEALSSSSTPVSYTHLRAHET